MRGAPDNDGNRIGALGIIPADAGSTIYFRHLTLPSKDHPRGCGEHAAIDVNALAVLGSSPRMRGARYRSSLRYPWTGIIPADAGSTDHA